MRRDGRLLVAVGVTAAVVATLLALFAVGGAALVVSTLTEAERAVLSETLAPRVPLFVLAAVIVIGLAAAMVPRGYRRWIAAPAHLLEETQVLLRTDTRRELSASQGSAPLQGLARAINELARQRDHLRQDMAHQVAQASHGVEQERNRLAALMSELTQSVVVCNLDGRILLYNQRARSQFRALSEAPELAGGSELIGLGRSIHAVIDRELVGHALELVQSRLRNGVAQPSAQFVTTTRSGQLLRAQMAPVLEVGVREGGAADAVTGFVLMLDNITRAQEQASALDSLLHGLTEGQRGSLANLQAAVEMLDDPTLDSPMRERFQAVVRDEVQAMSRRIHELAAQGAQAFPTRWPLEQMRGADFVMAAQRRIEEATGLRPAAETVDGSLWLEVDSFSLLQALAFLALRLHDELAIQSLQLRLGAGDGHRALLDLVWVGSAVSTETVMAWELDPMAFGSETRSLTVREVVQRHGAEFWFERDRDRQQAFFRFLLPLAPDAPEATAGEVRDAPHGARAAHDGRPEYYDFDLFASTESTRALDDRPLTELAYTVFDTETTGLDPVGGDEILQIGAARLVNGRLLRSECFDQLVNPRRSIPAATIPIHGITPERIAGAPIIDEVLPAFHAYARDTVLVAHNAAFDMRFLQLKEQRTGIRFDQPVLDTLLLSAVIHPRQESHRLEAIAERLAVPVIDRHTALGDAITTAEVFLKMIPLLASEGIHTLGQAREAARRTYYARVQY